MIGECDENVTKTPRAEGSANLRVEGEVTTNQDGGHRKLVWAAQGVQWIYISLKPAPGQLSGPKVLLRRFDR